MGRRLAPDLSDHAYVCTIAEGYTEFANEPFRRYVGLSRSRVTDHRSTDRSFDAYRGWLDGLTTELTGGGTSARIFERYAQSIPTPDEADPVHVLLDIEPSIFQRTEGDKTVPLEIEDAARK